MKILDREKVKLAITNSVKLVYAAHVAKLNIYRNTLDCFSASVDSLIQGITLDEWLVQEKERQIQKTKQNVIGSMHEDIIGSIEGMKKLPVGQLVDIVSDDKKLVAEIKNKHNTTKGNHRIAPYNDLVQAVTQRPGYTGYYVEILPAGAKSYNKPFVPSDNKTGVRMPSREDIRIIDGNSFYKMITGSDDALLELYKELPILVAEILKEEFNLDLNSDLVTNSDAFMFNFNKAYKPGT